MYRIQNDIPRKLQIEKRCERFNSKYREGKSNESGIRKLLLKMRNKASLRKSYQMKFGLKSVESCLFIDIIRSIFALADICAVQIFVKL